MLKSRLYTTILALGVAAATIYGVFAAYLTHSLGLPTTVALDAIIFDAVMALVLVGLVVYRLRTGRTV
jgi:hypothetical protein